MASATAAGARRPAVSQRDLSRFQALLAERTGMAVPASRRADLERAVQRAVGEAGAESPADLYRRLQRGQGAEALDALVLSLDVNETHFFRDSGQMVALQRDILPELIAARGRERRLRLWSAGCSTGEEAYTLAILLHRLLGDLRRWDVLILATDVNGRSLERAARGLYGEWSFRGVPLAARAGYFSRSGRGWQVIPALRGLVTFGRLNLVEDSYPSPLTNTVAMDLILCRNVLLYFDPVTVRSVVGRLGEALRDDGRLLLSQVEAVLGPFEGLQAAAAMPASAIYRKATGPAAAAPAGWPWDGGAAHEPAPPVERPPPGPVAPAAPAAPTAPAAPGAPAAPAAEARPGDGGPASACGEALDLWRSGHSEQALGRLQEAVGSDPLAPAVHYLLGLIRLDQGLPDEALASFRRCTCADPGFALGHLAKAGQLGRMGRRQQARASLDNAVRLVAALDPDEPLPHGDGLTAGQVLSLASAHRALLEPASGPEARHG